MHVGADYIEESSSAANLAKLYPFLMWHSDLPMPNSGGFAYFTVSQLAQKHVKVSLTGHGGDELFAGYPAQFLATYGNSEMFHLHRDPLNIKHSIKRRIIKVEAILIKLSRSRKSIKTSINKPVKIIEK